MRALLNFMLRRWRCEYCGTWRGVKLVESMTQYEYYGMLGTVHDPNRMLGLCPSCKEQHVGWWTAEWHEYYAGLL